MPRAKKSRQPQPQPPPESHHYPDPDSADLNLVFLDEEEEPEPARTGRNNSRNATTDTTALRVNSSSPEPAIADAIVSTHHLNAPVRHSILGQVNFSNHSKSRPVDIRDDLVATEKVSDQYTPPSDAGLSEKAYGRSPIRNSSAVSDVARTPPIEPGFSTRASLKLRSPPISPPQRYSRPLSFGGNVPPVPAFARNPASQYGSPPAPHLPQPHFYAAQDVDLGLAKPRGSVAGEIPTFSRLVQPSAFSTSHKHGILLGYNGHLRFCAYDGGIIEDIGALILPGIAVDATLLQWPSGEDPFASLRPLVAVNVLRQNTSPEGAIRHILCISVYSLGQQKHISDLLTLPIDPVHQGLPVFMPTGLEFRNHLRVSSSSRYLVVSSGKSGEVFVFTPVIDAHGSTFECLSKFWTSIQPREPRRDSSHNRPGPLEVVSVGTTKISTDEDVPIVAISGRWLAVCPPSTGSQHTVKAVLDEDVITNKQAGLELTSPGSRPSANCDVDSPDADTLLGKVARGVAQEMVKGAKWLGGQGMQAWQNYWRKDDDANTAMQAHPYSIENYQQSMAYGQFPPTHADLRQSSKDPEIISIFDLRVLQDPSVRRTGPPTPLATFLPPQGCSFLSFAPNGLMLMTASRKGDYQYVWDLMEMKTNRTSSADLDSDGTRSSSHVRQLARFDRLSGSTIIDVIWEIPSLTRFALLTKNKTIHLFELPLSAMRWPPPRRPKKNRPTSAPPAGSPVSEHGAAPLGGFFASAMNIAGKTQPMLSSLRGRAPSARGGFAGLGSAGFGIATATGARGSKAVASGLSKSLGAATDTVSRLQHAGESRLHLKGEKEAVACRIMWTRRAHKSGLCVLTDGGVKFYQVRRSKTQDQRQHETTVFDARRAVSVKYPSFSNMLHDDDEPQGYWKVEQNNSKPSGTVHPLSFAEIDTNAPYQPFHSDRRVTLYVVDQKLQETQIVARSSKKKREDSWVFGDDIPMTQVNTHAPRSPDQHDQIGSVMYRETAMDGEQVVSTTRRRKKKLVASQHNALLADEEGFFEDDFEVLDFASDRV